MRKIAILIMLIMLCGCGGVMNQYDRDAAEAHYKAQEAMLKTIAAQLARPACTITGSTGADFKAECYGGAANVAGIKIDQYQQPEHPMAPMAIGAGAAISALPTAIAGTVIGVKALDTMGKIAESARGATYNQNLTGGSTGTIRTSGNVSIRDMGDGNVLGGQIDVYDSGNTTSTTTDTVTTEDNSVTN